MNPNVFTENFTVTVWPLNNFMWENTVYAAEIKTEKGHTYKTGILSEHDFVSMVQQRWQDRITQIIIIRGKENEFLSSKLISDSIKNRLKLTVTT